MPSPSRCGTMKICESAIALDRRTTLHKNCCLCLPLLGFKNTLSVSNVSGTKVSGKISWQICLDSDELDANPSNLATSPERLLNHSFGYDTDF